MGEASVIGCLIIRYAADWRQQTKARVQIPLSPGPSVDGCLCQAIPRILYACLARVLSSAVWEGGRVCERSFRLYDCQRCGIAVIICWLCDNGQKCCAEECARIQRQEAQRRAGARYQRSRRGAQRHAARQHVWRERRAQQGRSIVTHTPYASAAAVLTVPAAVQITAKGQDDAHDAGDQPQQLLHATPEHSEEAAPRCDFCQKQWLGTAAADGVSRGGTGTASVGTALLGAAQTSSRA
jgi:hypothetical protein